MQRIFLTGANNSCRRGQTANSTMEISAWVLSATTQSPITRMSVIDRSFSWICFAISGPCSRRMFDNEVHVVSCCWALLSYSMSDLSSIAVSRLSCHSAISTCQQAWKEG